MNEEQKQVALMADEYENVETISVFTQIPYSLISSEIKGEESDTLAELTRIKKNYIIYKKGASFSTEGTNGKYVEQIIRPTGLLDPLIEVRGTEGQIDDIISEIRERIEKRSRSIPRNMIL